MRIVGFTGTQQGMTLEQGRVVLDLLSARTGWSRAAQLHHGDCIGADQQAHKIAVAIKVPLIVIWPPMNSLKAARCWADKAPEDVEVRLKPAMEYLQRDWQIALNCTELVATPKGEQEELRSGTWATIRYARKFKRHIYIILPNGKVKEEVPSTTEGS